MKRPSFQFYPADWLRDTALRTCSIGARGLWMDMLCFMHEGNPYGWLKVGNKVILPPNLAAMVGATLHDVEGWLNELRLAGVFDEAEDGCIMSRRMVRDENLRQIRASGGKLGGNPKLAKGKVNLPPNLSPNLGVENKDNQNPTPSSSSSSSSSSSLLLSCPKSTEPSKEELIYLAYPRKEAKQAAIKAIVNAMRRDPHVDMIEAVQSYAAATAGWPESEKAYIPHPATWFNRGSYLDDRSAWTRKQSSVNAPNGFAGTRRIDHDRLPNGEVSNEAHERGF